MREDIILKALSSVLVGARVCDLLTPPELAELGKRARAAFEMWAQQQINEREEAEKARRLAEIEAAEKFRKEVPWSIAWLVKYARENVANDLARMALVPTPVPIRYVMPSEYLRAHYKDIVQNAHDWLNAETSTESFTLKFWPQSVRGPAPMNMSFEDEVSFSRALSGRSLGVGCVDFDEFVSLCSTYGYHYVFSLGSKYHPEWRDSDDRMPRGDYWSKALELRIQI